MAVLLALLCLGQTVAAPADVAAFLKERARSGASAVVREVAGEGADAPRCVLVGRPGAGDAAASGLEADLALSLLDRVDVVAADVGWLDGEAVDRWVRGGEGELPALLARLQPWSAGGDGAARLLRELRKHNAESPRKVGFAGILPGAPDALLEDGVSLLREVAWEAALRVDTMCGLLRQRDAAGRLRYFVAESTDRYLTRVAVGELLVALESGSDEMRKEADPARLAHAVHAARLLGDALRLIDYELEGGELDPRGDVLAQAAVAARTAAGASARLLALVHQRDLARVTAADSFAAALERLQGAPARCVAIAALEGSFLARDPNATAEAQAGPRRVALDPAGAAPLEALLAARGPGAWAVDLRSGAPEWLAAPRALRAVPAVMGDAREAAWELRVARDLDALVWRAPSGAR